MTEIIEASQLPENEKVYLKKDWSGWRVVEPIKDENGKINWKRVIFGTKRTLIPLIIYIVLAILFYIGVKDLISSYQVIADNPCRFCADCFTHAKTAVMNLNEGLRK